MKSQYWTITIGVLALVYIYATYQLSEGMLAPLSTRNVTRMGLVAGFFILLVFGSYPKYRLLQFATGALAPISVFVVLIYVWIDPIGADGLAKEGRLLEDLSFLFLMTGACAMAFVALVPGTMAGFLLRAFAAIAAVVFFLIGMEEISWFQRVLEIESGEFFLEHNAQGETNIHNIYTDQFEDAYYLGGFLLLVVLPYFRSTLANRLRSLNYSSLQALLPSEWLVPSFVLSGSFATKDFFSRSAHLAILIGSLIILIGILAHHASHRAWWRFGYILSTMALLIATLVIFSSIDAAGLGIRTWTGREYREFYIAWGISAYAISVMYETLQQRQSWPDPKIGTRRIRYNH